jgi:hypothetical protein
MTRGDAPHVVRRLPLAIIFRAFGAGVHIARIFRAFGAGLLAIFLAPLALVKIMEHQTAVQTTQADRQNQAACCSKPDSSAPEQIYLFRDLHQRIGNRAVGRMVQAKLNISGSAVPEVQRKCDSCAEEEEVHRKADEELIQRKSLDDAAAKAESAVDSISGGEPLPASARNFFEPRFGHDFSGVRIHTGSPAAESANAINAQAYTKGKDIVFGEGQYSAGSTASQNLLAHELAHVVQQSAGRVQPTSVQRSVLVEPEDARSEMLDLFNDLCPSGGFRLAKNLIMSTCPKLSGPACECLCNVTRDTNRTYNINVQNANRNNRLEVMHDGVSKRIPDSTTSPQTVGGTNPQITMTRSSSPMEFSVFSPGCTPIWLPNWRILGHELCGHGRLNQTYSGDRGDREEHNSTIETENKIAAEHGGDGSAPRGKYTDPRQGEVATNPVGDRSMITFKLKDGWYYESPTACVAAPPAPGPPGPKSASTTPESGNVDEQQPQEGSPA